MQASVHQTESTVVAVLIQLIVIILAARAAGAAAAAMRQPRAVGEIIAGLLLGPSLLGHLMPGLSAAIFAGESSVTVAVLAQLGLLLLMFQIGSEFEFTRLGRTENLRAVTFVAIASVAAPLAIGFVLGRISAPILAPDVDPLIYSLFVAVAMAITAVPILGRILREYGLTRADIGVVAISAAAANDVVGWLLLAGIAAYAAAAFSLAQLALSLGGLLALIGILLLLGRPAVRWLLRRYPLEEGRLPGTLTAIVLALIFVAGICTQRLGVFTIFGGFLLGLAFHRHREFVEAWRAQVGQFVLVFFLPIFFTYTGLRTNVLGLVTMQDWLWCGAILAAATLSKVVPVHFAARAAGMDRERALILGVLMNTRALMELVVLNIGYSLGFIPQQVFTMLVIMAVATTVMTGPLLQLLLPRAGYGVTRPVEA